MTTDEVPGAQPVSKSDRVRALFLAGEELSGPQVKQRFNTHKSFIGYVVKAMRVDGYEFEIRQPKPGGVQFYRLVKPAPPPDPEPSVSPTQILTDRLLSGEWLSASDATAAGFAPQALSVAIMTARRQGHFVESVSERVDGRTVKRHRINDDLSSVVDPHQRSAARSNGAGIGLPPQPALGDRLEVTMLSREADGAITWRLADGRHHWLVEMRGYTQT